MTMTSKEMIRFLKKHGFKEVECGNGSHRKFQNPITKKTTTVPYHSGDLGTGLTQAILKQAGLKNVK